MRAVARFSHDPKEVHVKAARKIIEYLRATAHLGLTLRKDSKLEDVQLEYDWETYVEADYAYKADDRRSVSGVAVCCRGTLVAWFSRTQKCVTLSTTEAEYVAMAYGRRGEGSPLRERSAGFSDAQSGVAEYWSVSRQQRGDRLGQNPFRSSNSTRIDIRYHFLRELVGT